MARPKVEIPHEDVLLIRQCKQERTRLRDQLKAMPKNKSRMNGYRDAVCDIHKQIDQLTDESLAEKFELAVWRVRLL